MIAKIKFEGDFDYDYIYYSNDLNLDIQKFSKWLYENKSHPFWIYDDNGELEGVDYRGNALVYWINEYFDTSSDKAYIIKEYTSEDLNHDLIISL